MNGAHDMGGMQGFGPVDPEPEADEPVFHAEWERRAFAITLAAGMLGRWNIDKSRYARERQNPADYLAHSYYENWLAGLETLLVESGLVTADELRTGKAGPSSDDAAGLRLPDPETTERILLKGGPTSMQLDAPPKFDVGDRVRVHNRNPLGHTRAPRYARGRQGVVHLHHGAHVFPDRSALGIREGQHLYSVRFSGRELWGAEAPARDTVHVDLWEPYLEPA